jgi:uncharacterized phage infection (PIP) family protein YhgE
MLDEAREVCLAAAAGDLESRIMLIDDASDFAPLLFAINHLLNMTDAYVRESTAAMAYAAEGKFFRRVLPEGMLGSFGHASKQINQTITQMKVAEEALEANRRQIEQDATDAMNRQVDQLLAVTDRVGQGDLTVRSEISGDDPIGRLAAGVNLMIDRMGKVLSDVQTGAVQIDLGAQQIAEASQDLANGATEQADSLSTINSSVQAVSDATQRNVERSAAASERSTASSSSAARGLEEMKLMKNAMGEIQAIQCTRSARSSR